MVISFSLAVALAVIVGVLVKTGYQRIWPGIACLLLGFALASTGFAPGITAAVQAVTGWISST